MKTKILLVAIFSGLFCACASNAPTTPAIDASASQTLVEETASATPRETATAIPSTATPRPSTTPRPTFTATPTRTPLPELPPNAIDLQWMIAYRLPGDQVATMILPTIDGGFVVVGNTIADGPLGAFLLKLRADGLIVWQQSLPQVKALEVLETSAGDFILAGEMDVIRFDPQGNLLWHYDSGQTSYLIGPIHLMLEESNGDIVVEAAGSRSIFNAAGERTYFAEKEFPTYTRVTPPEAIDLLNLEDKLNEKLFFWEPIGSSDALVGTVVIEDYGLVASWLTRITVARFSDDRSIRWQGGYCCFLGGRYEDFRAIETASGETILAGTVIYYSDEGFRSDFWLLRLDGAGKTVWDRLYVSAGEDPEAPIEITFLQELSNGDLIFAGYTDQAGLGGDDVWLFKTNAQGEIPNCALVLDGSVGLDGSFPEIDAPLFDDELNVSVTEARAVPICSPSP